ncbi:MAG TPA: potassium channel family protein [Solirubrobacteraceae bacterium]|nr:potassium channel family protein [Solirubrobacteraceae bacterium]
MSQPAEVQGAGGFRYGAVLLFTLVFAVFALIVPDGSATRTIELFAAGATLFVAVLTSRAPAATRRLASAGVAIVVVGAGVTAALVGPHPALTFAATAALLALTAAIILAGLVRLVVERGVVLQAVFGALAVYMLVGLTFSFLIGALATGESSPYFAQGTDGTQNARVYFSFTALTTTGFGDYTAATRGGRALAVLEMLVGQLYLVTVIATLVGNLRHQRK